MTGCEPSERPRAKAKKAQETAAAQTIESLLKHDANGSNPYRRALVIPNLAYPNKVFVLRGNPAQGRPALIFTEKADSYQTPFSPDRQIVARSQGGTIDGIGIRPYPPELLKSLAVVAKEPEKITTFTMQPPELDHQNPIAPSTNSR